MYPVSSEYMVEQHTPLSFIPAVILLIPFLLLDDPTSPTASPFSSSVPFLFSFSPFPQAIMTIPIDVKDITVSNSTMSDM